jgi:hypothetical protein
MYSWERPSQRRRLTTIRKRAALAWRSPPRLSLRRWGLPEDFSTGLVPHRAAKAASLPRRSGLSPAAMSKVAALSAPASERTAHAEGGPVRPGDVRRSRSSPGSP